MKRKKKKKHRTLNSKSFLAMEKDQIVLVTQSPTLCDPMDFADQAPLSMEFSRQELLQWVPFPSLGDLPRPGIEPGSPALGHQGRPSGKAGEEFIY